MTSEPDDIARLVEAGQVLDGLTVAEATDRGRVQYGIETDLPEEFAQLTL